jgi:hypothetical protein
MPQDPDKIRVTSPSGNEDFIIVDVDGAQKKMSASDYAAYVSAGGGAVPTSRQVIAGAGLTGGGDLSADRTLNVAAADSSITVNADSIQVGFGTPVNVGTANADGAATTAARSNHVHGPGPLISDADGDTTVEVERTADDDVIRFKANGTDILQTYKEYFASSSTNGTASSGIGHTSGDGTTAYVSMHATKGAKTATLDAETSAGASAWVMAADSIDLNGVSVDSSGNITMGSGDTVDGRDISVDGVALDTVVANYVTGPASATDNAIARFDGTTGKLVQNSGITLDDSNYISTPNKTGSNNSDQIVITTGTVVDGTSGDIIIWPGPKSGTGAVGGIAINAKGGTIPNPSTGDIGIRALNNLFLEGNGASTTWNDTTDTSLTSVGGKTTAVGIVNQLSGRTLTAGVGLSGGGTLAADRTFTLDLSELTEIGAALTNSDWLAGIDQSASDATRKILMTRIFDYILAAVPLASTTWGPTFHNLTSMSAVTNQESRYLRVGNNVWWATDHNCTLNAAASPKSFDMSPPVASAFTQVYHATGYCWSYNAALNGTCFAETTNDRIRLQWLEATAAGTRNMLSVGCYRVL